MGKRSPSRRKNPPSISISSESSFYGSESEQERLESLCEAFDPIAYLDRPANVVEQALRLRPRIGTAERSNLPCTTRVTERTYVERPRAALSSEMEPESKLESNLDSKSNSKPESNTTKSPSHPFNPYEHELSAWHLDEACADFLTRLPPSRTFEEQAGPWIWAANPTSTHRETSADYRGLLEDGEQILDELSATKEALGRKGATRYHAVRTQAQKAILDAAQTHRVTTGKWLLFRDVREIDETWSAVASGTIQGKLGSSAKVATRKSLVDGGKVEQVICVYTPDFSDEEDVVRVLCELDRRGLVTRTGPLGSSRGIYYKPDVYTHLGISRGNPWNIPPSLYASTTFIGPNQKPKAKGRDS